MFNPIKAASSLVSTTIAVAKSTAKIKAALTRATADTDGDGIPQYGNILTSLSLLKDRLPGTWNLLKVEGGFYKEHIATVVKLTVDLFLHVVDRETPKEIAALEQENNIA